MDKLTAFGLFAVTTMLVFYALERRSRWYILGFSLSCILGSVYGFLQGAWPFGIVEGIWSLVAFRRFWLEAEKNEPKGLKAPKTHPKTKPDKRKTRHS